MMNTIRPADDLLNEKIGNDWEVIDKLPNLNSANDGQYSFRYIVRNSKRTAFMKAVDLSDAETKVGNYFEEIERITKRANNEKEIAELCSKFKMKHVVRFIEGGEFISKKNLNNKSKTVHYIIYEKATKDSSTYIEKFNNLNDSDIYIRLKAIHNISNALRNLHTYEVAHQDIKPSNILLFKSDSNIDVFKIGDFDSAIMKSELTLDEELDDQLDICVGTYQFAPIDILYEHVSPDWNILRKGTDLYLLGSLISYYFTGRSLTEMIGDKLHRSHHWHRTQNKGKYIELLPDIETAFEFCLNDLNNNIPKKAGLNIELCNLIRKLSHPNPLKRGEKPVLNSQSLNLSLIRTVSKLGNLMVSFK